MMKAKMSKNGSPPQRNNFLPSRKEKKPRLDFNFSHEWESSERERE